MYISILKCGPGLLFIGLSWPSVQVEFEMPGLDYVGSYRPPRALTGIALLLNVNGRGVEKGRNMTRTEKEKIVFTEKYNVDKYTKRDSQPRY
jgi:hypothetical protein